MVRLRSPAPYGGFPERPKGADCKSVVTDFGGPNPPSPTRKKHFCLPTKVRFLNDVCLRQMMLAPPNDVRYANDVCLTAHWANIASLQNEVKQHHICEANASYRRTAMHHLKHKATPQHHSQSSHLNLPQSLAIFPIL